MADSRRVHSPCAVFRLEFGGMLGWGHLARCAALAAELRVRGWQCVLWTDGDPAVAPADLRDAFTSVRVAGASWAVRPLRSASVADWLVIDIYAATDDMLHALRSALARAATPDHAPRVLVLDDEGQRQLDAASHVLNARPGLVKSPYASGVTALLGEAYALLRPGLKQPIQVVSPFSPQVTPVLIMFGGTDARGLTCETVEALADIDAARFAPVVVRGKSVPGAGGLMRAFDRFPESVWLESIDAPTLAGWAQLCRYAISAAGGTLYELAFAGLPFVAVTIAENQRQFAAAVHQRWKMPVVEAGAAFRAQVARAFRELVVRFPVGGDSASRQPFAGVDGLGSARVADVLVRGLRPQNKTRARNERA